MRGKDGERDVMIGENRAGRRIGSLPPTCKTCRKRYRCLEYTRWYPCREYEKERGKKNGKKPGNRRAQTVAV